MRIGAQRQRREGWVSPPFVASHGLSFFFVLFVLFVVRTPF